MLTEISVKLNKNVGIVLEIFLILMTLVTLQMELPGGFGPLNTHNLAKTLGKSEISNNMPEVDRGSASKQRAMFRSPGSPKVPLKPSRRNIYTLKAPPACRSGTSTKKCWLERSAPSV